MLAWSSMNSDAKWLAWFEHQFVAVAGSDGLIDFNQFKQALHLKEVCAEVTWGGGGGGGTQDSLS